MSDVMLSTKMKSLFTGGTDVTGHFDQCDGASILGWAASKAEPAKHLEVELIVDGRPLARAVADLFRQDLKDAGVGTGRHAFSFVIPAAMFDGEEHTIVIQELSSGFILPGSPKSFKASATERGDIWLNGSVVSGWARIATDAASDVVVELFEGNVAVCAGVAKPDSKSPSKIHFHVPLPPSVLDGRPHLFSVRCKELALTFGEIAVITPYMLTPETALIQYAREGMKPAMCTAAGFRYDSFTRAIRRLDAKKTVEATVTSEGQGRRRLTENTGLPSDDVRQLLHVHDCLVRGLSETDRNFAPLVFLRPENPSVSIVIPVHNKFHVTYHCLCSLLLAQNEASFEVIIVDDGSKDESKQIPELISGVEYVRNNEAEGFIRACNRGASFARGDYIVMLNNDTEVTSGWLDELLWPFSHFEKVGMTGAKLVYPDGSLQEAGGIVWNTCDPWNYGRKANPHDPRFNYTRQPDYISGACIMLPRVLWDELRGFDETFRPAYFEDTDLAFRVRDKGFKTVYTPLAQVIHFEGVSSGTSTSSGIKKYQEINRPKFKSRWVSACRNNGKVGADLELNKDRNVEFRALVLDAETPMPDKNAGSYAAIQEMRMLQALGFKCTFAPTNMAWMGHYTEALQRMGIECVYAPFAGSISEIITSRGNEFDLIYVTRYYVAQQFIELIRRYAPQAKIVLNNADLHFLRELRSALETKRPEAMERAVKTRDEELSTMRKVDLVLSYTDVEKAVIISHNLDSTRVAKCPWVTDVVTQVPSYESRKDIAFLGGFNHRPNTEAVEWFAGNVMPLLREALPGVKFRVFGSNAPKSLRLLADANDDVIIEGWVPTVDTVYNSCRVFVAPLQSGAGIKGKVIGALAYGVPSILSPIAAEGIPIGEGIDAFVARKPEQWVSAISRIYGDESLWSRMSSQARVFASAHYGFERAVIQMQEALMEIELFTTPSARTLLSGS